LFLTLIDTLFQDDNASNETGQFGAVVLPTGLRPANPLKSIGLNKNELELTRKIVDKHKERVRKLDQMKEDAFQKSLHYAAQTGATAAGVIDPTIQKQIRDLLVNKGLSGENKGNSNAISGNRGDSPAIRPLTGDSAFGGRPSLMAPMPPGGNSLPPKHSNAGQNDNSFDRQRLGSKTASNGRPSATVSGEGSFHSQNSNSGGNLRNGMATAPGGMQRNSNNNLQVTVTHGDDFATSDDEDESPLVMSPSRQRAIQAQLAELEQLRAKSKLETLTTRKVAEELASNDTLLYIQKLEAETERLRRQVRDVSQQLHTCKVANASLQRNKNVVVPNLVTTGSRQLL
jgi:hypothetical protein